MATCGKRVCVLSEGERDELKMGIQPKCHLHNHVTTEIAFDMTAPLWQKRDGTADSPVAEWVGPRHIMVNTFFSWKTVRSSFYPGIGRVRVTVKQLLSCSA